ncbi:AraC family transcriptional regulator [Klebsiella pneumoniae]|nr:AraC family transcriptional regulator [Klebsiella pneumoniae]
MNDIKASPAYVGRFQRVCRYIARHLDEPAVVGDAERDSAQFALPFSPAI